MFSRVRFCLFQQSKMLYTHNDNIQPFKVLVLAGCGGVKRFIAAYVTLECGSVDPNELIHTSTAQTGGLFQIWY